MKYFWTVMSCVGLWWTVGSAPAHAQLGGLLGGGGEIVYDPSNFHQNVIQVAKLVEEIEILNRQLQDMIRQAGVRPVPWNTETDVLLRDMKRLGVAGDGIVYGGDVEKRWLAVFKEDATWDDGQWLENDIKRSHDALSTQKDLLRLIQMRSDAFDQDNVRILRLQQEVDRASGRNQLIKAQAALQAELTRQQQMNQLVNMTIANTQAVSNGYQMNEQMAREAQEREFLRDFGREPEPVVFRDRGL